MNREDVATRRLQPVYKHLECDNPEKALRELKLLLGKHPSMTSAHVLKALALLRLYRNEEAMAILDKFDVPNVAHDSTTLDAFISAYKEAGLPERICQLYENAVRVEETSTANSYANLFLAYVRTGDYQKQLSTVILLRKKSTAVEYFCWHMMTLLLNSKSMPFNLQLAAKGIEQYKKTHERLPLPLAELHIMMFEAQKDWKNTLEAISCLRSINTSNGNVSPKNLDFQELNVLLKWKADKSKEGFNYLDLVNYCRKLLKYNSDDWIAWEAWIETVTELVMSPETLNDKIRENLKDMLTGLSNCCSIPKRGPYMARLQLNSFMSQSETLKKEVTALVGEKMGTLDQNLLDYIEKFHRKPCLYEDVEKYIQTLGDSEGEWIEKAKEILTTLGQKYIEQGNEDFSCLVYEHLTKISLRLNRVEYKTPGDIYLSAHRALKFTENQSEENKDQIWMHPYSEVAFLSGAQLWQEWTKNAPKGWERITEAAIVLEEMSDHYPEAKISMLALMRYYGALNRSWDFYKRLDVKSVQLDSLCLFMFPMFELSGRIEDGIKYYSNLGVFFSGCDKDISESLVSATKNLSFFQIPGIVELSEKMKKSTTALAADVMARYLSGLFSISDLNLLRKSLIGDPEPIEWEKHSDNRDMTLLEWYEKGDRDQRLTTEKERSHREIIDITKLRHYLCQAIGVIASYETCNGERVKQAVDQLKEHLKYCRDSYQIVNSKREIYTEVPCRLAEWVHQEHFNVIVSLLDVAVQIAMDQDKNLEVTCNSLPTPESYSAMLQGIVPTFEAEGHYYVHNSLYQTSRALQCIATARLILVFIGLRVNSSLKCTPQQKKGHPALSRANELLESGKQVLGKLDKTIVTASDLLKSENGPILPPLEEESVYNSVGTGFNLHGVMEKQHKLIESHLRSSYIAALCELRIETIKLTRTKNKGANISTFLASMSLSS